MQSVILVIEDDLAINQFLTKLLRRQGYVVYSFESGIEGLKKAEEIVPDLALLDLDLPDISGQTICTELKKIFPHIPVIILTASTTTQDLVNSFDRGADDYITKPFVNAELLARINGRLKRKNELKDTLTVGDLTLDTNTIEAYVGEEKLDLTQTEFKLLHFMMANENKVLSREQILGHVWAQDPDIETRVVDVYIGYLRKKLASLNSSIAIISKRGFGYSIKS